MMPMDEMTFALSLTQWFSVEWFRMPDYVQVVMIKATEGDAFVDPMLGQHVEESLEEGKVVGLTHEFRTEVGGCKVPGVDQAAYFIEHTHQYWDDVDLRANCLYRGTVDPIRGRCENPRLGTESEELQAFHQAMHQSDWAAFDLLYTSAADWFEMKMENAANLWRGPAWMQEEPLIDGLWLDWHPYRRPRGHGDLEKFVPGSYSPRLPRPFRDYWAWQFSADFWLPGILNAPGNLIKRARMSVIPYPLAEVQRALAAVSEDEGEEPELEETRIKKKEGE